MLNSLIPGFSYLTIIFDGQTARPLCCKFIYCLTPSPASSEQFFRASEMLSPGLGVLNIPTEWNILYFQDVTNFLVNSLKEVDGNYHHNSSFRAGSTYVRTYCMQKKLVIHGPTMKACHVPRIMINTLPCNWNLKNKWSSRKRIIFILWLYILPGTPRGYEQPRAEILGGKIVPGLIFLFGAQLRGGRVTTVVSVQALRPDWLGGDETRLLSLLLCD